MTGTTWEELGLDDDYDQLWDRFESRFGFRASTEPDGWPAINEPPGSVTFDLSPAWTEDGCGF